jgi:hypothetical protein
MYVHCTCIFTWHVSKFPYTVHLCTTITSFWIKFLEIEFISLQIDMNSPDVMVRELKGQCHEIFDPRFSFINQSTQGHWASISSRNSIYLFEMVGLGGFNETAEADSAATMRPRNSLWHRGSLWLFIPLKGYYIKTNTYVNITYW